MSSLKERNGGIGAFPPHGYSTFITRVRRGEERAKTAAYSLYLGLCLSSPLMSDSPVQFGTIAVQGQILLLLLIKRLCYEAEGN